MCFATFLVKNWQIATKFSSVATKIFVASLLFWPSTDFLLSNSCPYDSVTAPAMLTLVGWIIIYDVLSLVYDTILRSRQSPGLVSCAKCKLIARTRGCKTSHLGQQSLA